MKKLLLIVTLALMVTSSQAETIKHGRITDKGIDAPRQMFYPFIGVVHINQNIIYWLKVDKKWHRVTAEEYAKYGKGQFFSRKQDYIFAPQF
jgi:hypothetical protein